jgi:paraquat-inducible protein B
MPDPNPPVPPVPESRAIPRKRTRLSLVWIVPILAAIVGAWVAVTRILSEGPTISIVFQSAEDLEAGKTKIHYNGVDVGTVQTIRLSDDHQSVIVTAQMAPKTESLLVEDTTFWVVRPRISGANVSGLSTLISGAYLGMEIGKSKKSRRDFVALETPPVVTGDETGRFFSLKTPELGSLDSGTPIYFRRLQVGQIASYALDKDGKALTIRMFVKAPYDQYVTPNTRFWQASGIDVSLTASGINVQTESLLSILVGGVAFETPATDAVLPAAEQDTEFTLFASRTDAFKLPSRAPQTFVLVFDQSVRGLVVGAPVEFRGIPVGEIIDVRAQIDAKTSEFLVPVTIRLDAERLGVKFVDLEPGADIMAVRRRVIDHLVAKGVRAQLQTGNLLTGALFVALDIFPNAPPATVDWARQPVELPTIPGELQQIEASVVNIIKKIEKLPFKAIGDDLQKAIVSFDQTLATAKGTLADANKLIEPNSILGQELGSTLQEVSRAARALRVLADYLERHPESLIRGKAEEKE